MGIWAYELPRVFFFFFFFLLKPFVCGGFWGFRCVQNSCACLSVASLKLERGNRIRVRSQFESFAEMVLIRLKRQI